MNHYEVKFEVKDREHVLMLSGINRHLVELKFNLLYRPLYRGKVKLISINKFILD